MAEMKNLDRVLARLQRIPQEVRAAVEAQLEKEADDMLAAIQRVVPVDTGNLRKSIRKEKGHRPLSWRIRAGGPLTTVKVRKGVRDRDFAKAAKSGGNKGEFDYARGVEFGHLAEDGTFVPAKPYFWPIYRARKKAIRRRLAAAAKKPLKTLFPKA